MDILLFLPLVVFRCADKKCGYRFTAVTRIGEMLNVLIKLTVCAYRPWIRSDLIAPAGDSKVAAAGYLTGFLVGSFVERHYIHYEIPFGSRELGMLSCIGAGFMITWKEYIAPATFVACLGGHWGHFVARFLLLMFATVVWPLVIRKVCGSPRGRRGRIEMFQQERTKDDILQEHRRRPDGQGHRSRQCRLGEGGT